jgi:hypothetical protein
VALTRTKNSNYLATLFNTAYSTYEYIPLESNMNVKIFDKGTGTGQPGSNAVPGVDFGEWVLIPQKTFQADIKMWGAGGGAHNASGGAAGGGGYARSSITFFKDKPYTLWVGQGGSYAYHNHDSNGNRTNYWESGGFGGGGNGGHNAGGGGGMSAIFYNTHGLEGMRGAQYGTGPMGTFDGPNQGNVILVAGGGGGAGHHSTSNHGQGGGGGGVYAHVGHAQSNATQTDAGHAWRDGSYGSGGYRMHGGHGGSSSYTGGGGGGYWGGAGGTHRGTGSHHNGGGGGSGHALDLNSTEPHWNYWIKERYPTMVRDSYMEIAPGNHQNHNPAAAASGDSEWNGSGQGAGNGTQGTGNGGRNGRIIMRVTSA